MTDPLLPCPFCGKSSTLHQSTHYHDRYYVVCNFCMVRTDDCRSQEEATSDWNTRYLQENKQVKMSRISNMKHRTLLKLSSVEVLQNKDGTIQFVTDNPTDAMIDLAGKIFELETQIYEITAELLFAETIKPE